MNQQFDLIVIGDSKKGNEVVKKIASANAQIKIAFVSKVFKSTTTHDYLNVEYIKEEIAFIDYKNRLFGCYLKNGDQLYSTHVIIASGIKYEPFKLGNRIVPNVFNTTDDLPKQLKNQPVIVIGKENDDIKFALAVAKKVKQVYFCIKDIQIPNASTANLKKLETTDNIVVLPNASVIKILAPKGSLKAVELDNYSAVTCSAIFIKTRSTPDIAFVSNKLMQKNAEGFLLTKNNLESTLAPNCFAIGNCTSKSTKTMMQQMVEDILKYFKEEN